MTQHHRAKQLPSVYMLSALSHDAITQGNGWHALARLVPLGSAMLLNVLWLRSDPQLALLHPYLFQLLAHIPVFAVTVCCNQHALKGT